MPFKMTPFGGRVPRGSSSTKKTDWFKVSWRPKRHCTSFEWMEVRAWFISFHAPMSLTPKYGQNAVNSDGLPILVWMLPIAPASEVCAEEEVIQTRPFIFHAWWTSGFLVGSDASWAVDCHRIMLRAYRRRSRGVLLGGLWRPFAFGYCDQYRFYVSYMTIKTHIEVCLNECRAIL